VKAFNAASSAVFDVLLAPLGHAWAALDLLLWPVLAGIGALLVYKRVSNQAGIRNAQRGIQVHLLEVVLYRDQLGGVLLSTAKALWCNALYVGHNILPMAVMILPMTALLVQLVAHYAYAPLPVGSSPLLEVQMAHGRAVDDVRLDLPAGVTVEAGPVTTPTGIAVWRLHLATAGDPVLTLHAGDVLETKALAVGGGPRKVPVLRTSTAEAFLYPGEAALPSDSPFESIRVAAPARPLAWLPDGEGGILAWFFVASLASGFLLRGRFGVTL
jgi:hypothetical protein